MAAWWKQATSKPSGGAADMDEDEPIIDLTSDTEASLPVPAAAAAPMEGVEVISPWMLQQIAASPTKNKPPNEKDSKKEVKSEGMKKAAEASKKAEQSGEVVVTSKPAEDINLDAEPAPPAKRAKGPGGAADDDDLAVMGTIGTKKLPHNRFACTEHTFGGHDGSSSHKEKCSLCFCYVCDRLASDCLEWSDHCHATDTGPTKYSWKTLRERAKLLLQAGKRPPVSGKYGPSSAAGSSSASGLSSPPSSSSSSAASAPRFGLMGGLSGSGGSSSSSSNSNNNLPNECNCEELCKPVHHVFFSEAGYESSKAKAAMVYLGGLTEQQAQHVEDISVRSTVEIAAKKKYDRRYGTTKMSNSTKANVMARLKSELEPAVHVVNEGGKRNVTIAAKDPDGRILRPFAKKWTPGFNSVSNPAVRLGAVSDIPFRVSSAGEYKSPSEQKTYFERFVSTKPMPPTLWFGMERAINTYTDRFGNGSIVIEKNEDKALLNELRTMYEQDLVDVEVTATYNSSTNVGSYSLEIVLLSKLLRRGTSMVSRTPSDFVPIVERVVLQRVHKAPSASAAASRLKQTRLASLTPKPSSAMVNGGELGQPVAPGKEFSPSTKGYGGCSSLDVTLSGLIDSVRLEESNSNIQNRRIIHPAKMLVELENLQHRALPKQPACLTVQLYEHQKQDAQWMKDQEMLKGGAMQHLWAELPPHPQGTERAAEFRRCWFSPILNQFTIVDPFTSSIKGGILCDEMGLGKTAATLVLHLIHQPKTPAPGVSLDEKEWGRIGGHQASILTDNKSIGRAETPARWVSKGTLVVCKVSLVGQWVEEAKRLCGGALTIYPYHGQSRNRDPAFLSKFDMVVTTYGVVQADLSRNGGFPPLRRIRWWRVVLDESHTIYQKSSDVMGLVANRRWCMTGTPYISRFSDVNGQLGFMGVEGAFNRGSLGDKGPNSETQAETVAFLRRVLLRHSQGMQLGGKSILGLPTITHKVEVLKMPTKEREAYQEFEKNLQNEYVKVRYRLRNHNGSHTMEVLTLLSKFRQACSGGQLLVGDTASSGAGAGASSTASFDAFCPVCSEILESPVTTYCGHTFCQACISSILTKDRTEDGPCPKCKKTVRLGDLRTVGGGAACAAKSEPQQPGGSSAAASSSSSSSSATGVVMETKLQALVQKLADIHAKDPTSKSLVFSQFNSSLDWLKRTLPKKGFQFRTLTGSMSRKQRTDALSAFARDPPTTVFLLSVRSGAVGINLTQANNVFLLEPLLNLALEKQAVGRVYRLGQERPVTVTKLVLEDSVETRIIALQKKQAAQGAASAAATSGPSSQGVAGNIAKDNAKNLRIEEYNALFGVSEAAESVSQSASAALQRMLLKREKAKKAKKAKRSFGCAFMPPSSSYHNEYDSSDY
eukprot:g16475.t1